MKLGFYRKRWYVLSLTSNFLAHTNTLFYRTNILKIEDIHIYLVAIHAYKMNCDNNFNNFNHNYLTRNRNYAIPTYQRLALTQHSVSFAAHKIWNGLPNNIKECTIQLIFIFCNLLQQCNTSNIE
jgi:hypothetical protein